MVLLQGRLRPHLLDTGGVSAEEPGEPYGHEIIFIGSGGIFEYTGVSKIASNIHREMMVALTKMDKCSERRSQQPAGFAFQLKHLLKKLIGRTEEDLYDLQLWMVFCT